MIASAAFSGKSYAVYGLARSGLATVEALLASGANVMAWDEKEEARAALESSPAFAGEGDQAKPGGGAVGAQEVPPPSYGRSPSPGNPGEDKLRIADPLSTSLYGFAGIVVSPGVPLNRHPIAARAREAKVPLIGDIELFAEARAGLPPHKVVGITGTNGKSTTTALIHHILTTAGVPTTMGGNIGLPILGQDPLPEGGVYVLELSSYQLDLTQTLDCDVAVLLNVTPDHLDRYDGFDSYVASKERLFTMQSWEHDGIFVVDDPVAAALAGLAPFGSISDRIAISFTWHARGDDVARMSLSPALQGPHNSQNASAAVAVARHLKIDESAILRGLATYPGLPHRMERVRERDGVLFVNDSKATNPNSTAPALAAYPAIHWILGGRPKGDNLEPCEPYLGHVRAAYTIGEAGPMFARLLSPKVRVEECGLLDRAVGAAAGKAKAGEVVLLSPACASFDQFKDYEARGEAFRAAVEGL
ncbi:MAG: UDP-N-acetylmuramoylalanine--D-glutamate ligase [Sphingomonadales bacterium]|jgi:UDP-N-acetylmuramoylalanine--D-glutamate ligase|nr:UDP-N-acetylmuramoylalanine--D-glutamate ligase [Sphingomonadales bacterium]